MAAEICTSPVNISSEAIPEECDGGTKGGSVLEVFPQFESTRTELEAEMIQYFISFVQIFGLPKSIGQIYGLLFASPAPLSMSEIVSKLGISKGSASQGLALLRRLGAVTLSAELDGRREQYRADLNVSRIVRHFFDHQLRPRLEHSEDRLERILELARADQKETRDSEEALALLSRVEALQKWQRRGKSVLPLIARWLLPS